jgi:hypothetical protein
VGARFSVPSRPTIRPSHPLVQWILCLSGGGFKRPECGADHPLTFRSLGLFFLRYVFVLGHVVAQLAETLRYKPEGHGFDS